MSGGMNGTRVVQIVQSYLKRRTRYPQFSFAK